MKKLIIVSATLMSAAMVYGTVDYFVSNKNGSIDGLYHKQTETKKQNVPNAKAQSSFSVSHQTSTVKQDSGVKTNTTTAHNKAKRSISLDEYSRAPLMEEELVEAPISLTLNDSLAEGKGVSIQNSDSAKVIADEKE